LYAGITFAQIISSQSTKLFFYITSIVVLVNLAEYYGVHVIPPEIEKDLLLTNSAEVLTFHILAAGYLKGTFNRKLILFISGFSGSKFLIISSVFFNVSSKIYLLGMPILIGALFFFNPSGSLDTRISLYQIFIDNICDDLFFLQHIESVNNFVTLESTIYSFHNVWMDYLWYGGVVGFVAVLMHLAIISRAFTADKSYLEKSLVIMYFLCITFGFSVFFGTAYTMMMLGVILFKLGMESQNQFVDQKPSVVI
jgi:hypothetical protein